MKIYSFDDKEQMKESARKNLQWWLDQKVWFEFGVIFDTVVMNRIDADGKVVKPLYQKKFANIAQAENYYYALCCSFDDMIGVENYESGVVKRCKVKKSTQAI